MNKIMKTDWAYLAGLIDGDGCFTISLTQGRGTHGIKKNVLSISPRIAISLKSSDGHSLCALKLKFGLGNIYHIKTLTCEAKQAWIILKIDEIIYVIRNLLPYLWIKKEKGIKFLELCEHWKSTSLSVPDRMKGIRHTQSEMLHLVEVACTLNYDRQTVRYRDKKGLSYWTPLIKEWYPE